VTRQVMTSRVRSSSPGPDRRRKAPLPWTEIVKEGAGRNVRGRRDVLDGDVREASLRDQFQGGRRMLRRVASFFRSRSDERGSRSEAVSDASVMMQPVTLQGT